MLNIKIERMGILACQVVTRHLLAKEVKTLANSVMRLEISKRGGLLANIKEKPTFLDQIKAKKVEDLKMGKIHETMVKGKAKEAILDGADALRIVGRFYVPRDGKLILTILAEAHSSKYSVHPNITKMYCNLRQNYWWSQIKPHIMEFVFKCQNC
ncbi:hypothetical protein MTR67_045097 [Solanum verrucosum]|uniref:Integrase zinc-binding domain-containing protein n=1 Tax=Solanum verrucosum TaxID=315347 RepID=A0AAF0USD2_SOLVR|nr:hypothetical protein MTR67_045097 [Solanum verrucosum]